MFCFFLSLLFYIQVTQWEIIYDPCNVKQMNLLYNKTWQCNKGVALLGMKNLICSNCLPFASFFFVCVAGCCYFYTLTIYKYVNCVEWNTLHNSLDYFTHPSIIPHFHLFISTPPSHITTTSTTTAKNQSNLK